MDLSRVAVVLAGACWVMLPWVGGVQDAASHNWKPMPPAAVAAAPHIPLRGGLTVVSADRDLRGDYEAVEQITQVDGDAVSMTIRADVPEPTLSGLLGGLLGQKADPTPQGPTPT